MEGVFRVVFLAGSGAACIVSAFLDVLAFEVVAVFFADFLDAVVFLAAVVLETVTFSAVSDMAFFFTAVVFCFLYGQVHHQEEQRHENQRGLGGFQKAAESH